MSMPIEVIEMKKLCLLFVVVLVVGFSHLRPGLCADSNNPNDMPKPPAGRDAAWHPQGEPDKLEPPVIKKLGEGVFLVGNVTVNKPEEYISADGEINMDEGLVEYLACGPMGKLHESVLILHAQPYHLQVAALLLGLEPGDNPLDRQGGSGIPQGDSVEIWVSWRTNDQKEVRKRAEDLIFNVKEEKSMPHTHWVYTGSQIIDGKFIAQTEQSIIATYHDPFAMFDHPLATGMDDTLFYANKQKVPPKGTPVTLIIKPTTTQMHKTP
jgi:hypothetical protein